MLLLAQLSLRRDVRQLEEVGMVATVNGSWGHCRVWGQARGPRAVELLLWTSKESGHTFARRISTVSSVAYDRVCAW